MTANALEGDSRNVSKSEWIIILVNRIDFDKVFQLIDRHFNKPFLEIINTSMKEFITKTGISKDESLQLYKDYLDYMPTILEEINKYINNNDYKNIRELAHQLKGSSGTLRIEKIQNLAYDLEKSALNEDINNCKRLFLEIRSLFS